MEGKSVEEVCEYLYDSIHDIDESVLDNIRKHKIDGSILMQLNEEYLREVVPLVGDRVKVRQLISKSLESETHDTIEVS